MVNTPGRAQFEDQDLESQPIERADTIPSYWSTDPAWHVLDREVLFERHWHYVGSASSVAEPGTMTLDTVANNPILVLRDQKGVLRAFYNVCKHRGGPLAVCPGSVKMLQCKYHGWTYRLDGSLRGVPRFDRAELFDPSDYGLEPIHVATWNGLLFVNLSSDRPTLDTWLTGIADRIRPTRLDNLEFHSRHCYEVACNWKVYVDNYLEGYHLPFVHPELCTLLDIGSYDTELSDNYSLQLSALDADEGIYGAEGGMAYYYFVFPNFMLNILPDRLQTNRVVPIAHDRCRVEFDYYYADGSATARIEEDQRTADHIQQEDIDICEHVQRGLNSRAYTRGRFSVECEQGVHHFQEMLKKAYKKAMNDER